MIRDYDLVSPSLEGVLNHESLVYEGVKRPTEMLRALDGPRASAKALEGEDRRVLEDYFHDLYGVFMKRLSYFVVGEKESPAETLKLQAMLQEMVRLKGILAQTSPAAK